MTAKRHVADIRAECDAIERMIEAARVGRPGGVAGGVRLVARLERALAARRSVADGLEQEAAPPIQPPSLGWAIQR
jgi:hypothetical protein